VSALRARLGDELPFGFSWLVDEPATRTSHALAADGRVWLVDPVDWAPALERARTFGAPAAVVQLLDRHRRDCAGLAARLGVPHVVVPDALPGSPFQCVPVVRRRGWRESALWWPDTRTLVVAEAVGTNAFFRAGGERVGVHLLLRLTPPRRLAAFEPEHLLVGHGEGVHGAAAAAALREAILTARRRLPPALLHAPALALDAVRRRR
jgi:hypothetical protein